MQFPVLHFFFGVWLLFFQEDIPFKPNEEFEIKLEYEFKPRPPGDKDNSVYFSESQKEHDRRNSSSMLPYLKLNVKVLKSAPEEDRLRVVRNIDNVGFNRRIVEGEEFQIDMGFTDDMKDRVKPYEYTIFLLSAKKKKISRIVILVDKDGSFFINREKRGKL